MLQDILSIVRRAGQMMREAHAGAGDITSKEGRSNFVTAYDVKIQQFLFAELAKAVPGAAFVGEEGEQQVPADRGLVFIIDPIDGTGNFIHGMNYSAVSVALAQDGRLMLAAVYNPYCEELFWAERGKGAFLNGRRLQMRDFPLAQGYVCMDSAPYYPDLTVPTIHLTFAAMRHSMDIRRVGSGALDISAVGAGRYVAMCSLRSAPWDYAAAWLILEEAGGVITDMEGNPPSLTQNCSVLAGTPTAHREFLAIANQIKQEYRYTW